VAATAAAAVAGGPLPAFAGGAGLPLVGTFFETDDGRQVIVFFAQTLISWGVPAAVALVFLLLAYKPNTPNAEDVDGGLPPQLAKALGLGKEPKEYLVIERLNAKLQSFDYSFAKATASKDSALRASERLALERRFGSEVGAMGLETEAVREIAKAEQVFRKADDAIAKELASAMRTLRATSLAKKANASGAFTLPGTSSSPFSGGDDQKKVRSLQDRRMTNELAFLSSLSNTLQPEQASRLAAALKPGGSDLCADEPGGGDASAVVSLADAAAASRALAKHVYVLSFFGDVTASQVSTLRQEITAVLRAADVERGDEVVLVLNTGGGTVTGYGLAAAQLQRLKEKGVKLTICVEQVAASGGYMMACVADTILCAPFAVIGSIGVITEQPNVYERLKKEGVVFSTVTAGKYKRTLTPTKQIDAKDQAKLKEDIEQVLKLFAAFVGENRPQLDIAKVATGETWLGPDALENKLVDGLRTVDEVLTSHVDGGAEVFSIKYKDPAAKSPLAALLSPSGSGGADAGLLRLLALQAARVNGDDLRGLLSRALAPAAASSANANANANALLEALGTTAQAADETERASRQAMATRVPGEAEPMAMWSGSASGSEKDDATWFL
jgi:signal peptide peptidase SppA